MYLGFISKTEIKNLSKSGNNENLDCYLLAVTVAQLFKKNTKNIPFNSFIYKEGIKIGFKFNKNKKNIEIFVDGKSIGKNYKL
jgi:hypothetical protein